ncbi:uncharacterized protein Bfra_005174 [Botrytis fragariae]|uniref:Uncharacterized protein n=1 Tax=Botrytis fragariae TaxID=1964551 RepID=A0A8H6AUM0_9HELO|nr:uncharacterized protein Bfra_005174 [Botrytis fragariae]KAF5873710.1 hypothetical protein Bfra_005174 [Botrytis fragariae]
MVLYFSDIGSDFFQVSSLLSRRSPTSIYHRPKIPNLVQYLVTSATLPDKECYPDHHFSPETLERSKSRALDNLSCYLYRVVFRL